MITRTISPREGTAVAVLAGISLSHLLNDTVQALVPAIYPMLKATFSLSFAQVGLMTLAQQLTASVLKPRETHHTVRFGVAAALGLLWCLFMPDFTPLSLVR